MGKNQHNKKGVFWANVSFCTVQSDINYHNERAVIGVVRRVLFC